MSADRPSEPVGLLHSPVPPGFEVRVSAIPAGGARPVADGEWRDTLVEIEHGEVDIHLARGDHLVFGAGDVLWLDHVTPKAAGGSNDPANLVASRVPCNSEGSMRWDLA